MDKRRVSWWIFSAGVPVLSFAGTATAFAAWRSELPAEFPTHWGASGEPDAFGGPSSLLWLAAVLCLALPALLTALAVPSLKAPRGGFALRFLAATSTAMAALGASMALGAMSLHRGHELGQDWPNINPVMLGAFGVALGFGVMAYLLQPRQGDSGSSAPAAKAMPISPGERVVWISYARISPWVTVLLLTSALSLAGGVVLLFLAGDRVAAFVMAGASLILALGIVCATAFRVTADATGLTVTAIAGWPRFTVPLDGVVAARSTRVIPLADFGGFGLRSVPGAFGVILRGGEALEIERGSGRRFVVTVDDAAQAAAVLMGLKAKA